MNIQWFLSRDEDNLHTSSALPTEHRAKLSVREAVGLGATEGRWGPVGQYHRRRREGGEEGEEGDEGSGARARLLSQHLTWSTFQQSSLCWSSSCPHAAHSGKHVDSSAVLGQPREETQERRGGEGREGRPRTSEER